MADSPYSGAIPQASTSTGSLFRLQSDMNNRARSKSTAADSSAILGRYNQPSGYQLGGLRPGWSTGPAAMVPLADEAALRKDDYDDSRSYSMHSHSHTQGGSFPLYSRPYANSPLTSMEVNSIPAESIQRTTSSPDTSEKHTEPAPYVSESLPRGQDASADRDPRPASSNAHSILQELRNSKDEGDTLDLSRKHIQKIDEGDVQILRYKVGRKGRGVLRLALSHNRLSEYSLDPSFSMLNRLRYLNLKGNKLKMLPQCLMKMPSLEILDVSRNEIVALPEEPGRLVQLRVLSISQNRLARLPGYLVHFAALQVLKVDSNPIEWPPPHILDLGSIGKDATRSVEEQMRIWIAGLKAWMKEVDEQDQIRRAAEVQQTSSITETETPDESVTSDTPESDMGTPVHVVTALQEPDEDSMATPTAGKHEIQLGSTKRRRTNGSTGTVQLPESPSISIPSHLSESSSRSAASPMQSSVRRIQAEDSEVTLVRETSSSSTIKDVRHHGNHVVASGSAEPLRSGLGLANKNSLPDLRQSIGKVVAERSNGVTAFHPRDSIRSSVNFHVKSLPTSRQGSIDGDLSEAKSDISKSIDDVVKRMSKSLERRESRSIGNKLDFISAVRTKVTIEDARDAYFKRLSTLPAPSSSNLVPEPLLRALDAIRGILFALSELHLGLKRFMAFSNNDSVVGVFARVMDPATDFLHGLVNALDRFDSMCRRRLPTVTVTKQVFESCRDAITVFIKVTSVLNLQVPAMQSTANHRYAQTLLMMVTGSLAEAIGSWRIIASVAADVKSFLHMDPAVRSAGHRSVPSMSNSARTPISPIPEKAEIQSPQTKVATAQNTPTKSPGQLHRSSPLRGSHALKEKSRRNAGSFSAEDLQAGMMLGPMPLTASPGTSDIDMSPVHRSALLDHSRTGSIASQLVIPEADNEDDEGDESERHSDIIPPELEIRAGGTAKPSTSNHFGRDKDIRGYRRHAQKTSQSSEGVSVPQPSSSTDMSPSTPHSPANVVDDGVLDTLEQAAAIADTVWLRLSEELTGSPSGISPAIINKKFGETAFSNLPPRSVIPSSSTRSRRVQDAVSWIAKAEGYTRKLHESLMQARANPSLLLQDTASSPESTLRLPFDAQNFIKAVVVVSKLVKAVSGERAIPASVKNLLQRLTAKTSECAILLEVSSLKPAKSVTVHSNPTIAAQTSLRSTPHSVSSAYK